MAKERVGPPNVGLIAVLLAAFIGLTVGETAADRP